MYNDKPRNSLLKNIITAVSFHIKRMLGIKPKAYHQWVERNKRYNN